MSDALSASPPYFACGSCRSLPLTTLVWLPVGCVYDLLLTMMERRILASLRPGNCGRRLWFAVRGLGTAVDGCFLCSMTGLRGQRVSRQPTWRSTSWCERVYNAGVSLASKPSSARHCRSRHACFHSFGLIAILVAQPG